MTGKIQTVKMTGGMTRGCLGHTVFEKCQIMYFKTVGMCSIKKMA